MKKKILTLAAVVTLPFILLVMYLLASMASYSNTYDEIVSNMTVANNYNLNFKEEMDESLYKLVVATSLWIPSKQTKVLRIHIL